MVGGGWRGVAGVAGSGGVGGEVGGGRGGAGVGPVVWAVLVSLDGWGYGGCDIRLVDRVFVLVRATVSGVVHHGSRSCGPIAEGTTDGATDGT
ncbi:hypothetical protein GCM10010211_35710 [Streptomyces albospinus]|uniref:Uncharacterized protein n=1 Tax=Streptomyces albospinus TaxID=285515 RepID=A0ABQ2V3I3_9ACTN|nr:hypothetical protein GCM10010211_35710 [Streptomyces albospinus]